MKSLKKSIKILEFIAVPSEYPKKLIDISKAVLLPVSTCSRIISALKEMGYVDIDESKGGYRLGYRIYYLSNLTPYYKPILDSVNPVVEQLSRQLREAVLLTILHRGRRMVLTKAALDQVVTVSTDAPFEMTDPIKTATGRLLLAFRPQDVRTALLAHLTWPNQFWPGISNTQELNAALNQIVNDGYAVRQTEEVVGIAVPIAVQGDVRYALGTHMPVYRLEKKTQSFVLTQLTEAAQTIQQKLKGLTDEFAND